MVYDFFSKILSQTILKRITINNINTENKLKICQINKQKRYVKREYIELFEANCFVFSILRFYDFAQCEREENTHHSVIRWTLKKKKWREINSKLGKKKKKKETFEYKFILSNISANKSLTSFCIPFSSSLHLNDWRSFPLKQNGT